MIVSTLFFILGGVFFLTVALVKENIALLFLGIFLTIIGLIIFGNFIESESKPKYILILPEEHRILNKGDTLIVEFVKDDKVYLMYP